MENLDKHYPYYLRWQQREGLVWWLDRPEPARESLWVDALNRVPIFATHQQLNSFVLGFGAQLERQENLPVDLDAVAAWVAGAAELRVEECLRAWNLFDDLSTGVQKPFLGNEHNPKRNRVFDLLYAGSGLSPSSAVDVPWRMNGPIEWQPGELDTLRHILTQGLELWQQCTHWQPEA